MYMLKTNTNKMCIGLEKRKTLRLLIFRKIVLTLLKTFVGNKYTHFVDLYFSHINIVYFPPPFSFLFKTESHSFSYTEYEFFLFFFT